MVEYLMVYTLGVATPFIVRFAMPYIKKWLKEKSKEW